MSRITPDWQVLDWIKRRRAGETPKQIAVSCGVSLEVVRSATNRVRAADLAESGEAPAKVNAGYW